MAREATLEIFLDERARPPISRRRANAFFSRQDGEMSKRAARMGISSVTRYKTENQAVSPTQLNEQTNIYSQRGVIVLQISVDYNDAQISRYHSNVYASELIPD